VDYSFIQTQKNRVLRGSPFLLLKTHSNIIIFIIAYYFLIGFS